MNLIVSAEHSQTQPPINEGTYGGRCIWVIDLGTQASDFGPKHKVLIGWELPEVQRTFGERTEPAIVHKFYTASLAEKSNLRRDLELWRGRAFTDAELRGLDLSRLIDLSDLNYTAFDELPNWIKEQIQKSAEWQAIVTKGEPAK